MTTQTIKKLRGNDLRNKVMETALDLFSESGYFNTSIHDIRRKAGVSTGAIYHHFSNKEALAKSLYDDLLMQMDDAISQAARLHESCYEKSGAIIAMMFELTITKPKMVQFILLAKHQEYLTDEPPICSSSPFKTMRQVVEEGIQNGTVRNMDPWVAATAMFGGALRMMNLQLDGVLTPEEYKKCVDVGVKGCELVYELQKKALHDKYFGNRGD